MLPRARGLVLLDRGNESWRWVWKGQRGKDRKGLQVKGLALPGGSPRPQKGRWLDLELKTTR